MPNYIVRRKRTKRAAVTKEADNITGARSRSDQELGCGIPDSNSAEHAFQEWFRAMFPFFESPAGK
jgi:hypothetical protein